jgi:hypothetical protein
MNTLKSVWQTRRQTMVLALLGVLLLGACTSEGSVLRTPDAPATLEVPGTPDGELVTLRHTSGVSHTMSVSNGTVRPPLLLDGAWVLETDGERVGDVLVGDVLVDHRTPVDGKALLTCWVGAGTEKPRATTPEGVRCTQSIVLFVAVTEGYQSAEALIETARNGLGEDRNLWGWYCNIAGDAAAMGAVLAGEDGRTLMRNEESFCDYSVLHGVGAATVLLHAENPVPAVRATCAPDPLAQLPTIARTSQCWHGAGTGFARISRLDVLEGEKLCRQAPEESSRMNCVEGLFSFARTYRLRGEDVRRSWPGVTIDGAACNKLDGSPSLLETCYRSSAQTLIHDVANSHLDSAEARSTSVGTMLATCASSDGEHTSECWAGLGTLVANSLHPDLEDTTEVSFWLNVCRDAPDASTVARCYERAALGVLENDQLISGLTVDEIIELVPATLAVDLRVKLVNWSQSLGGRSN